MSLQSLREAAFASTSQASSRAPSQAASSTRASSPLPFADPLEDSEDVLPVRRTTSSLPVVSKRSRGSMEDLSQYAREVGRERKLQKIDCDDLLKFSKLSEGHQRVWLAGALLKLNEGQQAMVAPEVTFVVPKSLKDNIIRAAWDALLDPMAAAYIDPEAGEKTAKVGPASTIYKTLCDTPSLGFSEKMATDSSKVSVIKSCIRDALTKHRAAMKDVIITTMGASASLYVKKSKDSARDATIYGIADLSKSLLKLGKGPLAKVTAQHCVRFALLRLVAATTSKDDSKHFWPKVDSELATTRKMPAKAQSAFLASLLAADREKYKTDGLDVEEEPFEDETTAPDADEHEIQDLSATVSDDIPPY